MTDSFSTFASEQIERFNKALDACLADLLSAPCPDRLRDAIRHSVLNGGKRLRPVMVYAAYQDCQGSLPAFNEQGLDRIAVAIELLHCYSLIHDDLPAMDDDDLRRGQPTCHIAFDEATAILAGDALQCMAFECIAKATAFSAEQRLALTTAFALASGAKGMVGGQMIDLMSVDKTLTQQQLETMHSLKTGALINAALQMGAICAEADEARRTALKAYGDNIGLAFQVVDDVLDIEGETATLGKQQGADQELNKPTYPAIMGLDNAKAYARQLCADAQSALAQITENASILSGLAEYVVNRKY